MVHESSHRRELVNPRSGAPDTLAVLRAPPLITTETKEFYIDLVFYNYHLKCFVLIDLKVGELTHQDVGQMDMYVRMFDDLQRGDDDNPTVGLTMVAHA